jgi:hypothetical protein
VCRCRRFFGIAGRWGRVRLDLYPRNRSRATRGTPFPPRPLAALTRNLGSDVAAPLALEDSRPVELELRIPRFQQTDRFFVERAAADPDAGRRAKPVKDARASLAAATRRLDDEGVLVAAFVLVEAELWQGYFFLGVLAVFFTAGRATRFAACRFAGSGLAAGFAWAVFRASAGVARCTSVNLVWSPIV